MKTLKYCVFTILSLIPVFGLTQTIYTDHFAFLDALDPLNTVIDGYGDPPYTGAPLFSISDAQMTGYLNQTTYETTTFADDNYPDGLSYCASAECSGSFRLSFQSTSVTEGGLGVCGAGFSYVSDPAFPFIFHVVFGNGSSQDYSPPTSFGFWGITSDSLLIQSIHVGVAGGGPIPPQSGTYIFIDNLSIGECLPPQSLPPSIPTLSQWGLVIFALVFSSLGLILVFRKDLALISTGRKSGNFSNVNPVFIPFDKKTFRKSLPVSIVYLLCASLLIQIVWGFITPLDILGLSISSILVAYLIHLIRISDK